MVALRRIQRTPSNPIPPTIVIPAQAGIQKRLSTRRKMNTQRAVFASQNAKSKHPGAARVGIGGPVGSGKTALLEQLIPRFIRRGTNLAVITNDLVTQEDAERVKRSGLIDPQRVLAVETGVRSSNVSSPQGDERSNLNNARPSIRHVESPVRANSS